VLDLNELLGEVKEMLSNLPAAQVQLMMEPSARQLPVKVDPAKIEQVIMNLVANACDAMPAGGQLTIKTARVSRTRPEAITSNQSVLYAVVEVSDTGSGIDAETRAHLFEPFFSTKPIGKGTGLGLSTAYGIVKQSGGSIEVESLPGKGTTFRVYLPIVEETISPRRAPRISTPVVGGSETVLLAEDQPAIRNVLCEFLESKGYKILQAENGIRALEIAKDYPKSIDVLVTDVIMPQLRGVELAKRLSEIHPGICVILMSGYSEEALVENRLLSDRNMTLIQKPFDPEELAQKIREALRQNSSPS
jgi:two-component system cell cycle sensor histidine kinase/response regulator CckA